MARRDTAEGAPAPRKLTLRLFLFAALALVPALGLQLYNELERKTQREAEAEQEALRWAELAASELDRIVDGVRHLLSAIASSPAVRRLDPVDCVRLLADLGPRMPHVAGIAIADREGRTHCRPDVRAQAVWLGDRPYFREALATRGFVVGEFTSSRISGQPVLPLALAAGEASDEASVVVIAALDLAWLSRQLSERGTPEGGSVTVADRNGVILARTPMAERFVGTRIPDGFQPLVRAPSKGWFRAVSQDGTTRIVGYVPATAGRPLYVSAGLSEAAVMRPVKEALARIAVLGVLGLLVAMVLAGFGAKALLRRQQERDRTEATLRESEGRFRAMADQAPVMIWVNGADGGCEFVNRAYLAFFGKSLAEVLGYGWSPHLHPGDRERYIQAYLSALAGRAAFRADARIRRADGEWRWIRSDGLPRFQADGVFNGYIGCSIDMTEAKQAELALEDRVAEAIEERIEAEAQLHQAQKMEAVGQLTGGVAHDFNNLLTAVIGNLELAQRRVEDDGVRRLLHSALRAADRGAQLTAHLLAFSRKQNLHARPVDLNELVLGTEEMLRRTVDPAVAIVHQLDPGLWLAGGDPTQLELAIINLAINARDAMPLGGTLTISTRNLPADAADRPGDLAPGDAVLLALADTGTGMSADVRAKAFEPFFTTKEVGKGSGLGLSMVYGVARQLGGTVAIESELGSGTTVSIYLPRAAAPRLAADPDEEATEVRGEGRVLLVDDDADVRAVTAAMIRGFGYEVVEADGAAPALALLERGLAVDLLVTDYAMPGMRGPAMAGRAGSLRPGLKCLMISGYGPEVAEGGDLPILRKPYRPAELAASLAALLPPAGGNVHRLRRRD